MPDYQLLLRTAEDEARELRYDVEKKERLWREEQRKHAECDEKLQTATARIDELEREASTFENVSELFEQAKDFHEKAVQVVNRICDLLKNTRIEHSPDSKLFICPLCHYLTSNRNEWYDHDETCLIGKALLDIKEFNEIKLQ